MPHRLTTAARSKAIGVFARRKFFRRLAATVLAGWCVYLLLAFLQPCCDPPPGPSQALHHESCVGSLPQGPDDSQPLHSHLPCPKFAGIKSLPSKMVALAAAHSSSVYHTPAVTEHPATCLPVAGVTADAVCTFAACGASAPLYLTTLRLRI